MSTSPKNFGRGSRDFYPNPEFYGRGQSRDLTNGSRSRFLLPLVAFEERHGILIMLSITSDTLASMLWLQLVSTPQSRTAPTWLSLLKKRPHAFPLVVSTEGVVVQTALEFVITAKIVGLAKRHIVSLNTVTSHPLKASKWMLRGNNAKLTSTDGLFG